MSVERAFKVAPWKAAGLTFDRFGQLAAYMVFLYLWGSGRITGPAFYLAGLAMILQGAGMMLRIVGWAQGEPPLLVAPQMDRKKERGK